MGNRKFFKLKGVSFDVDGIIALTNILTYNENGYNFHYYIYTSPNQSFSADFETKEQAEQSRQRLLQLIDAMEIE